MRRRQAGYTVVEVLVAAAVGFVLLSGSTTALVTGLGHQSVWQGQSELQASGQVVLRLLADELAETGPTAVRYESSPPGVVFISPRDALSAVSFDLSGSLLWQRYVAYYLDRVGERAGLVRRTSPLSLPTAGQPVLPPAVTTAWMQAQPGPARLLGAGVTDFVVTGANPLTVALTVSDPLSGRGQRITLATRVLLRASNP